MAESCTNVMALNRYSCMKIIFEEYINGKEHLKVEKRHRVNVYLSEEEYELLKNRQNESGKSQSEVLKESLYREQDIMDAKFSDSIFRIACWIEEREYDKIREEVKKYADYQIRERK